jgi:hypothetical protein
MDPIDPPFHIPSQSFDHKPGMANTKNGPKIWLFFGPEKNWPIIGGYQIINQLLANNG